MNKISKLFVAEHPCIYVLGNIGDPGWHKVGHSMPQPDSPQSVAARVMQIGRDRNKRPNARWFPDRIAEIKTCVSKQDLVAMEKIIADKIVELGYTRQGKAEYFKAPVSKIWDVVEATLTAKSIDFESTLYD